MSSENKIAKRISSLTPAERIQLEKWKRGDIDSAIPTTTIPRRSSLQPSPLSFTQERIWLLDQLQHDPQSLNQSTCVTLGGPLNLKALERSLAELQLRHKILTARFHFDGESVWQAPAPERHIVPEVIDLSGLPEVEASDLRRRIIQREASHRFDLTRDLLWRATILRLKEQQHDLFITTHLIVCDGWSMRLLLRELMIIYTAIAGGDQIPLAPPSVQYFDFAAWIRQHLQHDLLAKHLDYWRQELNGFRLLRLQTDRPRPHVESFQSAGRTALFPKNFNNALEKTLRRNGATRFIFMAAALQALFRGYSGQSGFLIFFANTQRSLPETEKLVGFFTNILVLKANVSSEISFASLLERTKESVLGAMEHHELPFQLLANILRPSRNEDQETLFQVMFTFLDELEPYPQESSPISWRVTELTGETERFDLHFFVTAGHNGIKVSLRYRTELFDATTAAEMLNDYQTVATEFANDPTLLVGQTCSMVNHVVDFNDGTQSFNAVPKIQPHNELEVKIAAIWKELLDLDDIGVNESFFALGGHSLLVPRLISRIQEEFQVEFPLERLFTNNTVEQLARTINAIESNYLNETLDLRSEAVLDEKIRPRAGSATWRNPQTVLLTGATGFIGAHLLDRILQQTECEVLCIVRANSDDEATERLRERLVACDLWNERYARRIRPLRGDVAAPNLGIGRSQFEILADRVDAIYHCACWVNFTYPYSALKPTNVIGSQQMLALAARSNGATFHLISSTAVFDPAVHDKSEEILESDDLESSCRISGGYNQSKWVADKLALKARDRGMRVCIYRPGWVAGHSETGVCNVKDFVWNLLKGCVQLGAAPEVDLVIEFAPVDHVAASIVHLAQQEESTGKAFHLLSTQTLNWNLLLEKMRSLGYHLESLPFDDWQKMLFLRDQRNNSLFPFLSVFRGNPDGEHEWDRQTRLQFDRRLAASGLSQMEFSSPHLETLLERYMQYFVRTGFLEKPSQPTCV